MEKWNRAGQVRDTGQALGLVLMAIALVAIAAIAMVSVGVRMTDRARAQNAADAAALAGVAGDRTASAAIAARNGGVLVSFDRRAGEQGFSVTVEVDVGDERAIAAASSEP